MDVAKHVELGLDAVLDLVEQVDAAGTLAAEARIAVADGRPVGDQNVDFVGNGLPLAADLGSALQVESPVVEPRLPRRPIDNDPLDNNRAVLKICAVLKDWLDCLFAFPAHLVHVERQIMVALLG